MKPMDDNYRRNAASFAVVRRSGNRAIEPEVMEVRNARVVESECGAVAVGRTYLLPPFRLAVPHWFDRGSVSTPRSSNRTCRFAASGSRTRRHAFTHDGPRPSRARRTSGSARKGARGDNSRPCVADLVLELEPPAQPHSRVAVERAICLRVVPTLK